MGNRGRFGKYGETKRLGRLRRARMFSSLHQGQKVMSEKIGASAKKARHQKDQIRIRPAKAIHLNFITRLSGRVFHIYGPYKEMVPQWFDSVTTTTLIAVENDRPVGFAMIGHLSNVFYRQRDAEILAIAVEPERQHKGIGQRLFEEIERKAAELKVDRIFLHTATENLPAQRLFIRNGFHSLGIKENFYPAGQDAFVMSKNLNF